MISEDLVRSSAASPPPPLSNNRAVSEGGGCCSDDARVVQKAFFVPVDSGIQSYCPRDLSDKGDEEDLRMFELLGFIIGASLVWNKVGVCVYLLNCT